METEDKKKYKELEHVLNFINGNYISLAPEEIKINNKILRAILDVVVKAMRKVDPLFNKLFREIYWGGSFYDGVRIGKPSEFDIDLLMHLPEYAQPYLIQSNIPGFTRLKLHNLEAFLKRPEAHLYPNFQQKLFDADLLLDAKKILKWMEGVVHKALNNIGIPADDVNSRQLKLPEGSFIIKFYKGGPAITLKVFRDKLQSYMDIDLVAGFVFTKNQWPKQGFRVNPVPDKPEFFIVPKIPQKRKTDDKPERYWRLSFQDQERFLIEGKRTLKPTLKLLKKLRDSLDHKLIASYFIKTVVLWINDSKSNDFWNNTLSYVFMTVLKEYQEYIANARIPYYWNSSHNLLSKIGDVPLLNISNRLKVMINDIEKHLNDPSTVAKYLLTPKEYQQFKEKITFKL